MGFELAVVVLIAGLFSILFVIVNLLSKILDLLMVITADLNSIRYFTSTKDVYGKKKEE